MVAAKKETCPHQGFLVVKLKSSLQKGYGHHHEGKTREIVDVEGNKKLAIS
jgi:hypothetical protein